MSESQHQMAETVFPSHSSNPYQKVGMETQITGCTAQGNKPEKINIVLRYPKKPWNYRSLLVVGSVGVLLCWFSGLAKGAYEPVIIHSQM